MEPIFDPPAPPPPPAQGRTLGEILDGLEARLDEATKAVERQRIAAGLPFPEAVARALDADDDDPDGPGAASLEIALQEAQRLKAAHEARPPADFLDPDRPRRRAYGLYISSLVEYLVLCLDVAELGNPAAAAARREREHPAPPGMD